MVRLVVGLLLIHHGAHGVHGESQSVVKPHFRDFGSLGAWQDQAPQQDPQPKPQPQPQPAENPHKDLPFAKSLDAALQYLKPKAETADPGIMCYLGWAFLLDGREEFKAALKTIIDASCRSAVETKHFNANWHVANSMFFLAEVYKRQPSDKVKQALAESVKVAAKGVEATGGWCHHKGYAGKSGYDKRGGGVDICMLTALMVGGLMNVKAAGLETNDSLISNGITNLKRQSRGGMLAYGTGNSSPDRAAARGSMLAAALWFGKNTSDPHFGEIKQLLPQAWARTESGHASGPLNFFAVALASYATGQYGNFASTWLGRLPVAKDGSVTMRCDGRNDNNFDGGHLADTAIYAVMILLQEKGILGNDGGGGSSGSDSSPGGTIKPVKPSGNSPFSKDPKKK
jgi:hypothetical protein